MSTAGKVDYRVRAAKQIERRMIGEALGLLNRLHMVKRYQYIGMGSISFVDFSLVHKALGITEMTSIEHPKNADRVRFNKPYQCIHVEEGTSHVILPDLDFQKPTIAWLDYDGIVSNEILNDIGLCAQRMQLGSVLMVTLNAESGNSKDSVEATLAKLTKSLKSKRFPTGFKKSDLQGRSYCKFLRAICSSEIEDKIHERNAATPAEDLIVLRQFLHFSYSDGQKMCTLGWIVDKFEEKETLIAECGLDDMPWYVSGADPFVIAPPVLTPHEVRALNRQLPEADLSKVSSPGVTEDEIRRFSGLYRHFPMYFEVVEA